MPESDLTSILKSLVNSDGERWDIIYYHLLLLYGVVLVCFDFDEYDNAPLYLAPQTWTHTSLDHKYQSLNTTNHINRCAQCMAIYISAHDHTTVPEWLPAGGWSDTPGFKVLILESKREPSSPGLKDAAADA